MSVGELKPSGASVDAGAACPACGARARRGGARFCATCGRGLEEGDYVPSEALRASYHFGRKPSVLSERNGARVKTGPRLTPDEEDGAVQTARAFVTYALVPYLGILFCPGALVLGGVAYARARRAPHRGTRRAALTSVALGLLILAAQLFLWWLLYKVPEWTGRP